MEVKPTYRGRVATKRDAYLLLEGCVRGVLFQAPRGPYSVGMNVQSGDVYIHEQNVSGITEWNDGKSWDVVRKDNDFSFYIDSAKELGKKALRMEHKGHYHYLAAYYAEDGETWPRPSQDLKILGLIDRVNQPLYITSFAMLIRLTIVILLLPVVRNEAGNSQNTQQHT
jgi:hypothetical protein